LAGVEFKQNTVEEWLKRLPDGTPLVVARDKDFVALIRKDKNEVFIVSVNPEGPQP
jgi:hypothetical protein